MNLPKSLNVFGWGVYCAVSWTWCIGMFLPLIMLERFGWAGFWVFAVPNVIGCAAFGYIVATRDASLRMLKQHGVAATWFSVVTLAYHMFFAVYFLRELVVVEPIGPEAGRVSAALAGLTIAPGFTAPLMALFALTIVGLVMSRIPDRVLPVMTFVVYALSLTTFTALFGKTGVNFDFVTDGRGLIFVAPVIIFGFALCPYLDLTFHRALQRSASRASFAVFGGTFALMILMTCMMWTRTGLSTTLQWAILAHVGAQALTTIALHFRELWRQTAISCPKRKAALTALPLSVGLLYLLITTAFDLRDAGGDTYLRFLGCYGLVFPLYVWVFMTAFGVRMSRPNLLRFIAAVALCAPLYELGFVHEQYAWLLIPAIAFAMWPVARVLQMTTHASSNMNP